GGAGPGLASGLAGARPPRPAGAAGVGARRVRGRPLARALARPTPDGPSLPPSPAGARDRSHVDFRSRRDWTRSRKRGTERTMTAEAQPKVEIVPVENPGDLRAALAIREVVFIEEQQVPAEIER